MSDMMNNSSPKPTSNPAESVEVHHDRKHKPKHDKHLAEKFEKKIAELESELAEQQKSAEELKDKWLRVSADFDNYRKRINKEKVEWREFAQEEIIAELFPVLDNFDRALAAMLTSIPNDHVAFAEGIKLVHKQFIDILTQHKVTAIDCVGKPFDPHFHEAVMTVPTTEFPEDTVVEEIQKGYMHNDKVIRPAMVKVSKPLPEGVEPVEPSKAPADTTQNDEELD